MAAAPPRAGDARRIAVRAQLLSAERPVELLPLVEQLTFLQLDPTAAIAPSADLIVWSRMGSSYRPEQLQQAIEHDRTMFERKSQDDPVAAAVRDDPPDIRPRAAPLPHRRFPPRARLDRGQRVVPPGRARPARRRRPPALARHRRHQHVPWVSTGWTHNQNVTRMLELLVARGEVATAGRIGRQRTWDLAERVYPPFEFVPEEEAARIRDARRLRALGIARRAAGRRRRRAGDGRGQQAPAGGSIRMPSAGRSPAAPRCSPPSTGSSTTACGRTTCSSSSTCSRCTSRPRSGGGGTSRCRSCTTTVWSGSSTRSRTARRVCCA